MKDDKYKTMNLILWFSQAEAMVRIAGYSASIEVLNIERRGESKVVRKFKELHQMLQEAIRYEDYEQAAQIRDRIYELRRC